MKLLSLHWLWLEKNSHGGYCKSTNAKTIAFLHFSYGHKRIENAGSATLCPAFESSGCTDVQICIKYSKELRVLFGALLIIQAPCSKIACFNTLLYNHEKIQTCLLSRNI